MGDPDSTILADSYPRVFPGQVSPRLQALSAMDRVRWWRNKCAKQECIERIACLHNPVQTWTAIAAMEAGEHRLSLESCRLRRKAEHEIDIDDEGAINQMRLNWEAESERVADAERHAEWENIVLVSPKKRLIVP